MHVPKRLYTQSIWKYALKLLELCSNDRIQPKSTETLNLYL